MAEDRKTRKVEASEALNITGNYGVVMGSPDDGSTTLYNRNSPSFEGAKYELNHHMGTRFDLQYVDKDNQYGHATGRIARDRAKGRR